MLCAMKFSQRGFSLVEILVGAALIGVVALVSASILTSQTSSIRYVAQKSEVLDIREQMLMALQSPDTCSCQLNPALTTDNSNDSNLIWNSAVVDGSALMNVKSLKAGCALNSPVIVQEGQAITPDLSVSRVDFAALRPTGTPGEWQGKWRVSFTTQKERVPIAPLEIDALVTTGLLGTSLNIAVQACKGNRPAGLISSCPAGAVLVGPQNAIGSYCIEVLPRLGPNFLEAKFLCGTNQPPGFGPAHMCDHSEFFTACKDGVLDTATGSTPGEEEFLGDFDTEYALTFRHTSAPGPDPCTGVHYELLAASLRFRCCWR